MPLSFGQGATFLCRVLRELDLREFINFFVIDIIDSAGSCRAKLDATVRLRRDQPIAAFGRIPCAVLEASEPCEVQSRHRPLSLHEVASSLQGFGYLKLLFASLDLLVLLLGLLSFPALIYLVETGLIHDEAQFSASHIRISTLLHNRG